MSNTEQQTELVDQFCNITGADSQRSRFFLESAAWNMQLALESFYENNELDFHSTPVENPEIDEEVEIIGEKQPANAQRSPHVAKKSSPKLAKRAPGTSGDKVTKPPVAKNAPSQPNRRFATLNDVKGQSPNDNRDESDSDSGNESNGRTSSNRKDRREAFFVGGSDESGQQVLGPSKSEVAKLTDRLFKEVRAHGALEASSIDNRTQKPDPFSGVGFRLGDSSSDSSVVPAANESADGANPQSRVVRIPITLYANGFTVDNGPLRQYSDPESREFLGSIMKNRVPLELFSKYRGSAVEVDLENKQNDNYVPPKVSVQPFQGRGYTLGSVLPSVDGAGQVGVKAGPSASSTAPKTGPTIVVDQSKPTTKVRIRLLNGENMVAEFNLSHRIDDIRRYVMDSDPSGGSDSIPFVFATSFPAQELTDESQTLEQAGLLNSSIVQKLKK